LLRSVRGKKLHHGACAAGARNSITLRELIEEVKSSEAEVDSELKLVHDAIFITEFYI